MDTEQDRKDRERRLVKMTSEEFASGFNRAFGRSYQEMQNRGVVLLGILFLLFIAYVVWLKLQ